MCRHQYEYEGHRSYGDNIPDYAQGAYFPGDEPGTRCALTLGACGNPHGDTPTECADSGITEWLCPTCQIEVGDIALWRWMADGRYFCPECREIWTEAELSRAYTQLLIHLTSEKADAECVSRQAKAEADALRKILDNVREAAGRAA